MPRPLRIEYKGAIYHVMNRGNHGQRIIREPKDVERFLKTLGEACEAADWSIHAFAVMGNHYHLLIETHRATLVRGMQWLNSTYTQRYNRRHKLKGHLFQGRYKAIVVDDQPQYLQTVVDYIQMNPVKAGLVENIRELVRWKGGSAGWLSGDRKECPEWLRWERVYGLHGMEEWTVRTKSQYRENLARRIREIRGGEQEKKNAGGEYLRSWCLGGEEFVEKLKKKVEDWMGTVKKEQWTGEAVREAEEEKVERLLREGLRIMGHKTIISMPAEEKYLLAAWVYDRSVLDSRWWTKKLGETSPGSFRKKISNTRGNIKTNKKTHETWKKLSQISA